ncbi:hypothetical protein P1X14_19285 [Sphingomonas sp. AOB5]|uniref:hypothetical protein n=1 Tax=Sphingomonas sp. AOB5 TaxID=3034017 RepID=UPI0023F9B488|nr:hypothetical protein [Sphingomonas sp. AOB5]MDF7777409.1 hypothetical protein [Sphingomonas sp. AOB5]
MSQFEFFMIFFGLLLGMAVAELFVGFAQLLRAKVRPRWGLLTPLGSAILLIFVMMTFLDSWNKFQTVPLTLGSITLFCMVGIVYFVAAVVAFPRDAADWPDLDVYFLAHRRWIAGAPIAAGLILMVFEIPAVLGGATAARIAIYIFQNVVIFGLLTGVVLSNRRRLSAAMMAVLILFLYGIAGTFPLPWIS